MTINDEMTKFTKVTFWCQSVSGHRE